MTPPSQPVQLQHRHAAHLLATTGDHTNLFPQQVTVPPTRVTEHPYNRDLLILTVSGELDTATAPLLHHPLTRSLPEVTVLDLTAVTFLGVAGLRVLEIAVARAQAEHRRIGLVTTTPTVLRIMRLFALDTRVPVYPLLAYALRELIPHHPGNTDDPLS